MRYFLIAFNSHKGLGNFVCTSPVFPNETKIKREARRIHNLDDIKDIQVLNIFEFSNANDFYSYSTVLAEDFNELKAEEEIKQQEMKKARNN